MKKFESDGKCSGWTSVRLPVEIIPWIDRAARRTNHLQVYNGQAVPARSRFVEAVLAWARDSEKAGDILEELTVTEPEKRAKKA